MKKRIIAFILALITILTLVSCNDGSKKEEEKVVDLSKYQAADGTLVDISSAIFAFFLYDYVGTYSYYLSWYGYDTSVSQCIAFASAAIEAGMSLSEDDLKDLDDYMKQSEEEAYKQGFDGLEGLLANYYCPGISVAEFRACMELQQLAYLYADKVLSDIDNAEYTDEELRKVVEDDKNAFYGIDYVYYSFFSDAATNATTEEKEASYAAAKSKAEALLASCPDIESFKAAIVALDNEGLENPRTAEDILDDYTGEHVLNEGATNETESDKAFFEWAYSTDRQAGDSYIYEQSFSTGSKYYTVIYITRPAYLLDYVTKSVRHILLNIDSSLTGDDLAAKEAEVLAQAQEILNTYKSGELTEEAFAALAVAHSQDGNATDGGIYENVPLGKMVDEFENWIYDEARVVGDTDIIRTKYGYHIMYFVGDGLTPCEETALNTIKDQLYADATDALVEKYPVTFNDDSIKMIP